eukprot:TRINITY_DN15844_c0_g1_i1.p1 TRINITY_DN15844_c0_g1~~TRINITY_DN15844_c0_g1_i1.p1  ORF type:complete len:168 (-),score=4.84 TRINITY_DN15844_c0_g1_i1:326-829(-)
MELSQTRLKPESASAAVMEPPYTDLRIGFVESEDELGVDIDERPPSECTSQDTPSSAVWEARLKLMEAEMGVHETNRFISALKCRALSPSTVFLPDWEFFIEHEEKEAQETRGNKPEEEQDVHDHLQHQRERTAGTCLHQLWSFCPTSFHHFLYSTADANKFHPLAP